jgi:hypothetical protein
MELEALKVEDFMQQGAVLPDNTLLLKALDLLQFVQPACLLVTDHTTGQLSGKQPTTTWVVLKPCSTGDTALRNDGY